MHVSERLLQLYVEHSSSSRATLKQKIKDSLATPTSLADSYERLTGSRRDDLSTEAQTADSFDAWLQEGKKDSAFLLYYIALLEQLDLVLDGTPKSEPEASQVEPVSTKALPALTPPVNEKSAELPKRRYTPEADVPSRTERAKYQRSIEPARPRKKRTGLWGGLFALLVIGSAGYIGYPYASALLAPSETVSETTAPPVEEATAEPVVETESTSIWLTEKNVSLLSEPNSDNVTYIGDIGDRYDVLEERDEHLLLDLGIDGMTAWAPAKSTTTEWGASTISDEQVLAWIETGVDPTFIQTSVAEYLAFSETDLYDAIGQPYGRDEDALNDYAFYSGIFFVIQDAAVHAIDWTNTGTTKEEFKRLGTPTIETEDAIVYESPTYSIRMFIGSNGTSRIRVTEI